MTFTSPETDQALKNLVDHIRFTQRQELIQEIKDMKYRKPKPSVFEVSFNLACDNLIEHFSK